MANHHQTVTAHSTDRNGGISSRPYHSFNLSYGVGDVARSVTENRQYLKNLLNIQILLSAKQVHGDAIFVTEKKFNRDIEAENYDALMTDIPGIGLMIQQADCQAVTLFDPTHKAIAAIHCGWKGSVTEILAKTVRKMNTEYHSFPSDLHATISPSLGPCCAEFTNHATELPSSFLAFQVKENYFDFWKISEMQLVDAGLQKANIKIAGQCTSCSQDYFSYRRACRESDGTTGRCATVIVLR
jgi:polyphenol oxidase